MSDKAHGMAVVGAGLVGSLTALLLANRGHHVDVYERRQDPRKVGDAAGRSINLALVSEGGARWKKPVPWRPSGPSPCRSRPAACTAGTAG